MAEQMKKLNEPPVPNAHLLEACLPQVMFMQMQMQMQQTNLQIMQFMEEANLCKLECSSLP